MSFPELLGTAPRLRTAAGALCLFAAGSALPAQTATADDLAGNPFLSESPLPYQYPEFDRIKDSHFVPAFVAGMAEQLKEVEAIARDPATPTFENTVVALERSGRLLGRVNRTFSNLTGANTNDTLRKIEKDISPRLAAHTDAIRLNPKLFDRLRALHDRREHLGLDPESKRLLAALRVITPNRPLDGFPGD